MIKPLRNIYRLVYTTFNRYCRCTLLCYYIRGRKYQYEEVFPVKIASSLGQLTKVCCDDAFRKQANYRFNLGHRLFYCCDKETLIAYGWLTGYTTSYYAWEIANNIIFHHSVAVLYDSYVNPNYRRRGIQKSLLHSRINNCEEGTLLVVYAESTNIPSNKAIISCGFSFVAKLTHFSNKIKQQM